LVGLCVGECEYRETSRQWPMSAGNVKNKIGICLFNLFRQRRRDGGGLFHLFPLLIFKLKVIFMVLFLLRFFLSLSVYLGFYKMIYC
jgi:hypothetical protein